MAALCFQFRSCFLVQRFSRGLPGQRRQGCLGLHHGTVYERRVDQVLAQPVLSFSKGVSTPKNNKDRQEILSTQAELIVRTDDFDTAILVKASD
jgi:hypothetical protein